MEKWLIWCDLNAEQDALEDLFGDQCVSIRGSTPPDDREQMELSWREGTIPIMITKPAVFGFGMNWQHCHNVVFVGLNDSYEQFYQAVRRCWRFGQKKIVNCHIVTGSLEGAVVANIKRKEKDSQKMTDEMVNHMQVMNTEALKGTVKESDAYDNLQKMVLPHWFDIT